MNTSVEVTKAITEAGESAKGIVAVEVWVSDDIGHLTRPNVGAWWVDRRLEGNEALDRLTNPNHPLYLTVTPVPPGIGLIGTLYAESSSKRPQRQMSVPFRKMLNRISFGTMGSKVANIEENETADIEIEFRNIRSLVNDPDTVNTERLLLLDEAGFGFAAGVPFEVGECSRKKKGIVVYYAKRSEDVDNIASKKNELLQKTETIARVIASSR